MKRYSPGYDKLPGLVNFRSGPMERTRGTIKALVIVALLWSVGCNGDPLTEMPEFDVILLDGSTLNTADIPKGRMSLFVYFDADCRECQEEAELIERHMGDLKAVNIYFLSAQDFDKITLFRDYFRLDRFPNVTFGQDSSQFLARHFQSGVTPLLALYGRNHKLLGVMEGKTEMGQLISSIKENQ